MISLFALAAQVGLVSVALMVALWSNVPWLMIAGVGSIGISTIAPVFFPHRGEKASRICLWLGWFLTIVIMSLGALVHGERFTPLSYCEYAFSLTAAALAFCLLIAALQKGPQTARRQWLGLSLFWGFLSDLLWLGSGLLQNDRPGFTAGLVILALLLVLLHRLVRLPVVVHQAVTSLILAAIALPIADYIMHPPGSKQTDPRSLRGYYRYDVAIKNREKFAQWWNYYDKQIRDLTDKAVILDLQGPMRLRLRRNTKTTLVDCPVSINSDGFRGKEIRKPKGDSYRIVVIGESTTFGYGINRDDKPWPELVEELIHERLGLSRPVEVINAGIPGATLVDNLARFRSEILPLQPDMIICYHGINGFYLLDHGAPALTGSPPPAFRQRPLQILADAEYGFRLKLYLRGRKSSAAPATKNSVDVMQSRYGAAYRTLIELARTNNIQLVFATFPLAVNQQSPPDRVEFLRPRNPGIASAIAANAEFTSMLQRLAQENPDIPLVDTHPGLDGHDDLYLDLMHLTGDGDKKLAENFFDGIRGILESQIK